MTHRYDSIIDMIDMTPGQSGPGSDGNKGVLRIFQSSSITGTFAGEGLTPLQWSSRCILQTQPTAQCNTFTIQIRIIYSSMTSTRQDLTQGIFFIIGISGRLGTSRDVHCWTVLVIGLLGATWTMRAFVMSLGTYVTLQVIDSVDSNV